MTNTVIALRCGFCRIQFFYAYEKAREQREEEKKKEERTDVFAATGGRDLPNQIGSIGTRRPLLVPLVIYRVIRSYVAIKLFVQIAHDCHELVDSKCKFFH